MLTQNICLLWIDRQMDGWIDRWIDRWMNGSDKWIDRRTNRYRQIERKIDRWMDTFAFVFPPVELAKLSAALMSELIEVLSDVESS